MMDGISRRKKISFMIRSHIGVSPEVMVPGSWKLG
jgi:hypothetical protein